MPEFLQIRDDQGRKITCLVIEKGETQPALPDGWAIEPADDAPLWTAPANAISDRQFAQALALAGTISEVEALAWAARGDLPEAMEAALAKIPEAGGHRFGARMMLAGATTFERDHPLTDQLGGLLTNPATGQPYDPAALDALWSRAAAL
ncbi:MULTISPECIES: hypothetical protein [Methylorubrum]|uniref:hypothetical protein n=1 Tax=Methylorubrum TaxID=2282523 RepID=UPI0020A2131F|nr:MULTISPECIES: hypothetical protein [Methylorubrum]MCP1550724.1 hypothetical protein [Methylorubrum zatmanii]MCP1552663.1 hypothetical protein [Methylorubrum extorquens]MCP1581027.1 hypothetical protein [Methylorubrum extorquens]